jgi:hypothetical protein
MTAKEDYLIWRHEQGTFTALSKKESRLSMWSTVTGKVLNTVTASGEAFQSNNNKKSTQDREMANMFERLSKY